MSYTPVCLNCHIELVTENSYGEEVYRGRVFCSVSCASKWAIDVTESYQWNEVSGRWDVEGMSCDAVVCSVCGNAVKYDDKSKWYCMTCKDTVEVVPSKGT